MKFIIDISLDLSANAQVLASLLKEGNFTQAEDYNKKYVCVDELFAKGVILNKPTDLTNVILSNKFSGLTTDAFIESFVEEFRDKFKNKKTGVMGSRGACVKKFNIFFEEFPLYMDKDLILSATDRYINSCRKDGFKYLMTADYFIYKRRNDGGGTVSTLATFCEEIQANMSDNTSSEKFFYGL